jgi:hypothetical protein
MGISLVHEELPYIIHRDVGETHTSWVEFCTTIKGVDMADIWDGVRKNQEEKEERERTQAAIAGLYHVQLWQHQCCFR